MNVRKLVTLVAASGLALAPLAASVAATPSLARVGAPISGISYFQDDGDSEGGGSTAVLLGFALIVLFGLAVISDNSGDGPNNVVPPPVSP